VLLFVVLVLILPSLSGTVAPTPTAALVAGNTTPQATTPLLIAETEDITAETAATEEVPILPDETVVPTEEQSIAGAENATDLALVPTVAEEIALETATPEEQESAVALAPTDTQAPTERQVTLSVTALALPSESPAPEESAQPSVEPVMTRTTLSDVAEATALAENAPTDATEVEYTEYLSEALQSFALAQPSVEQAQTSYGETVLARVCTNEGVELRETLRSVMEILANESDVVPEEFAAIGVRLMNCADDRTLRIISVDRESVNAYVSDDVDESGFEAQWRAQ
jgi:hypothetical protein